MISRMRSGLRSWWGRKPLSQSSRKLYSFSALETICDFLISALGACANAPYFLLTNQSNNGECMRGYCANCFIHSDLRKSHAIPRAAFMAMQSGKGNAIGIPYGDGNVHRTSNSGAAPLLCNSCEATFNQAFDAPITNALKTLENNILQDGIASLITYDANQLAHAIVAIAWRISISPAKLYTEVKLDSKHLAELYTLMRSPSTEILKKCTVRIARLSDNTSRANGGFDQKIMNQILKTPEVFSLQPKANGEFANFAMDWTMFGFLIHLIVPRLPYSKNKNFGGLKRNTNQIYAPPVDIFSYRPLRSALVAGYAADQEGRLSPSLKRRNREGETK